MNILKNLKSWFFSDIPKNLLIVVSLLLILFNLVSFRTEIIEQQAERQGRGYIFLGSKYLGLADFLKPAKDVGFLTDWDMDDRVAAMEFAQAEYVLAPVKLKKQSVQHEYVILSFQNPLAALQAIQQYRLIPLKKNQFNIILAANPNAKIP